MEADILRDKTIAKNKKCINSETYILKHESVISFNLLFYVLIKDM